MKSLNKVQLIGRLGADPEIRYTQDGVAVTNFSIATDRPVKKGDKWESETEWHRVIAYRRLGEIAGEYLSKGSQVYVEGRLKTRSWEDDEGNTRYITEVIVKELILLGSKGQAKIEDAESQVTPEDDEIPF